MPVEETIVVRHELVERCIKERRSVRVFKDKTVEEATIMKVLEAGNWAPSAGNLHSRHFVVVRTNSGKRKILECVFSEKIAKTGKENLMRAPAFIIVCANPKKCQGRYGEKKGWLFAINDASAAVQNMALMAHALGLGTCWIGHFDEEMVLSKFKIKEGLHPIAILPLGYPEFVPLAPRRLSIEEIAEFYAEAKPGESVYKAQEGTD